MPTESVKRYKRHLAFDNSISGAKKLQFAFGCCCPAPSVVQTPIPISSLTCVFYEDCCFKRQTVLLCENRHDNANRLSNLIRTTIESEQSKSQRQNVRFRKFNFFSYDIFLSFTKWWFLIIMLDRCKINLSEAHQYASPTKWQFTKNSNGSDFQTNWDACCIFLFQDSGKHNI